MKSMKMSAAESEKSMPAVAMDAPKDRYPYGLTLNLDQDTLEKLGIELPEVGEEVKITAIAKVTSCHASESEGGVKNSSCGLQITDMEVGQESSVSEIASRLYAKES
jgi:hypothetical protein